MIVLGSDHAGLKPAFQRLENELVRTFNRIDDPLAVVQYLKYLQAQSMWWLQVHESKLGKK